MIQPSCRRILKKYVIMCNIAGLLAVQNNQHAGLGIDNDEHIGEVPCRRDISKCDIKIKTITFGEMIHRHCSALGRMFKFSLNTNGTVVRRLRKGSFWETK